MKILLNIFLRFTFGLFFMITLNLNAQTQSEMTKNANIEYHKQDKILNNTYKEIQKIYKDDTLFINKLIIAEKAWLKFRDAYMESLYPDNEDSYGSDYPMCYSISLTEITKQRINQLKLWLRGTEEGDVCSGSVKTTQEIERIKNNIK